MEASPSDWYRISSAESMRGRVSLKHSDHPADFERADDIGALHRWAWRTGVETES